MPTDGRAAAIAARLCRTHEHRCQRMSISWSRRTTRFCWLRRHRVKVHCATGPSGRRSLIGRTIMNNRWPKLAVRRCRPAVILGLSLFTGDGAAKAYAKVVDQLHRAPIP